MPIISFIRIKLEIVLLPSIFPEEFRNVVLVSEYVRERERERERDCRLRSAIWSGKLLATYVQDA